MGGREELNILCSADDIALIAENEDNLQIRLYTFNIVAKPLRIAVSIFKAKCMITSKTPLRCKLVVGDKILVYQEI